MIIKFYAKISYTIDDKHPDFYYIEHPHRVLRFSDVYSFDIYDPVDNPAGFWGKDQIPEMKAHIKNDLALIAGGGYSTDHIHNIKFDIQQI